MTGKKKGKAKEGKAQGGARMTEIPEAAGELGADQKAPAGFPIVGIGASAGGLAAFEAFFSGMPANAEPGMAFVLVQHLAPDHKSILTELVRRYTSMQVFEVEDGMAVRPNCTYIIPPNRDMALLNGALQLLAPSSPRGQRLPIDFFFRSLAQDQHERAICVVLSGTGSDGTLGVRAVKGEGGMVMVQDPATTEYDGMPRSVIGTGLADYQLAPAEMPAQLIAYADRAFGKTPLPEAGLVSRADNLIRKIFVLLRAQTGHDFSQYKPSTIHRRIERRMAVQQIEAVDGYVKYLQQTPSEVEALFRDLLIGVTSFFRDKEAFNTLEETAIPRLFADKAPGSVVRVWVPGCSTGEEAYSLAILIKERLAALKQSCTLQIFATDIDRRSIEVARTGIYPAGIASDLTPERLSRFFTVEPGGMAYRVNKNIRDMLVFSEQNVIKDPPFSRLDLITCRNLLIYLGSELQEKLFPLFHYALNSGGLLFLGTAESTGSCEKYFQTLSHKAKLFRRKELSGHGYLHGLGRLTTPLPAGVFAPQRQGIPRSRAATLRELTERTLLQQRGLAAALINERGEILYLHGRSGRYLEPSPGEGGLNILKMAREGLRAPLSSALAAAKKETVRQTGLRVRTNGDFTYVNLTVQPVKEAPGTGPGLFLAILEPAPAPASAPADADTTTDERLAGLKEELRLKEEALQSSNAEMGHFNEELMSANEEMQSTNEELQSSNEELSTAKEELQSVNEELSTVNSEQQVKVMELSRANNDMINLMSSTGIASIFVDHKLCLQRFTPAATRVVNLIAGDTGRPLAHTVSNLLGYNGLVEDTKAVLETLIPKDKEVQTRSGEWFLLRIRPYRTIENVVEGATLTFVDISDLKLAQTAMRRLAVVLMDARDAILVQDLSGRILAWSPAAERIYGWSEPEALKMNFHDLIPANLRAAALARIKKLSRSELLEPYRAKRISKAGKILEVWVTATALQDQDGKVYAVSTTERVLG